MRRLLAHRCGAKTATLWGTLALSLTLLVGCGGESSSDNRPQALSVGGTMTGLLAGTQINITNNQNDALTLGANGTFVFGNTVPKNGNYSVAISSQPAGQVCTISEGTGTATSNISNISIVCAKAIAYAYIPTLSNEINQYAIGTNGQLTPLAPASIPLTSPAADFVTHPSGNFAYLVNQGVNTISQYAIATNGTLSLLTTFNEPSGANGTNITITPSGRFAYVLNSSGTGAASLYSIGSDGALTLQNASVPIGTSPTGIFIDPTSRFAYVTNNVMVATPGAPAQYMISQYSIGTDGSLTALTPASAAAGAELPSKLIFNSSARFAYGVAVDNVMQYAINADGTLSLLNPPTLQSHAIYSALLDPSGSFMYIATTVIFTGTHGSVGLYSIGADGLATSIPGGVNIPSQPPGLAGAYGLATDPSGQFLYVSSEGLIYQYSIGANGALIPLEPSALALNGTPQTWQLTIARLHG